MEKILFYEERDFQGKSYECNCDSADLQHYIRRCNSFKVERGWWVLYEYKNHTGRQILLGPGEFRDIESGFDFLFESCRVVKNAKGPYKLMLFDLPNFNGKSLELTENMMSTQEKWNRQEVQSCKVLEGSWIFFEEPNYCGRYYLLEKGEYRSSSEWGAVRATVGSIKRIMEL
ncbi:gamma-crystallin-2-like [Pagrus major]|uniref:gamma-crystallin-2-like n=1 Tax=Pagrus major TaxID=143350 RepID=UPI003CC8D5F0